jgi:hypothetical protein
MQSIKAHQAPDENPVLPNGEPQPDGIPGRTHEPPVKEPDTGKNPPAQDPPAHPQEAN